MNTENLVDCKMRYDYKPLKLEKGDSVNLVGTSPTQVKVESPKFQGDVEKVFISVGKGDLMEIDRGYVILPDDPDA